MHYEYRARVAPRVDYKRNVEAQAQEALDAMTAEGWEFVGAAPVMAGHSSVQHHAVWIFRRQMTDREEG